MRPIALFAVAAVAGCNPGDFGDALDRAPVQFIGRPDSFGPNAGRMLLPLAPPADKPKGAARLIFAGTETPSLAVADFDGDGKAQVQLASSEDLTSMGLIPGQGGISSAAWLNRPGSAGVVALGMPAHEGVQGESSPAGRVAFISLLPNSSGKLDFERVGVWDGRATDGTDPTLPRGHFGLALARGQVTQAASDEVVIVADYGVDLLAAAGAEVAYSTCMGYLKAPPDLHRSIAVADFLPGGNQEIAVGLPVQGGVGKVVILQYGTNPSNPSGLPELFCAGNPLEAPDSVAVAGFGTALAAGPDLDGDGLADLVVGAPPDRAYVFYSPFDGSKPPLAITKGDTVSEFGQRVALVDINADGRQELAITALQANVGQTPKAGQVLIYKLFDSNGAPIQPVLVATVNDSNPTGGTEFFGIGLAELEFNSSRACAKGLDVHLLAAGADKGIFTFFRFLGSGPDPRCFAQK